MSKLVFRSGDYLNHYIDDVVDFDPAYIVEMYATLGEQMGITEAQYDKARRLLDEWDGNADPVEDFAFLQSAFAPKFGSYDD